MQHLRGLTAGPPGLLLLQQQLFARQHQVVHVGHHGAIDLRQRLPPHQQLLEGVHGGGVATELAVGALELRVRHHLFVCINYELQLYMCVNLWKALINPLRLATRGHTGSHIVETYKKNTFLIR